MRITPAIAIGEDELAERFDRADGPGGQHADRAATAVTLRFDARRSPSLPEAVRARLERAARGRMSRSGVLVVRSARYRSQARNRRAARERLRRLIAEAARPPKRRKRTAPPRSADRKRLERKREHGEKKHRRRAPPPE